MSAVASAPATTPAHHLGPVSPFNLAVLKVLADRGPLGEAEISRLLGLPPPLPGDPDAGPVDHALVQLGNLRLVASDGPGQDALTELGREVLQLHAERHLVPTVTTVRRLHRLHSLPGLLLRVKHRAFTPVHTAGTSLRWSSPGTWACSAYLAAELDAVLIHRGRRGSQRPLQVVARSVPEQRVLDRAWFKVSDGDDGAPLLFDDTHADFVAELVSPGGAL